MSLLASTGIRNKTKFSAAVLKLYYILALIKTAVLLLRKYVLNFMSGYFNQD